MALVPERVEEAPIRDTSSTDQAIEILDKSPDDGSISPEEFAEPSPTDLLEHDQLDSVDNFSGTGHDATMENEVGDSGVDMGIHKNDSSFNIF